MNKLEKLPKGYAIRRTKHGYVGYLKGVNGPLWECGFDFDRERIARRCRTHWEQTKRDLSMAIAAAKTADG